MEVHKEVEMNQIEFEQTADIQEIEIEKPCLLKEIWDLLIEIMMALGMVIGIMAMIFALPAGMYVLFYRYCPGILRLMGIECASGRQLFWFLVKFGSIGLLISIGIIAISCVLAVVVKLVPCKFITLIGSVAVLVVHLMMIKHFQIGFLLHLAGQYDKIGITRGGEIFFFIYSVIITIIPVGALCMMSD